MKKSASWQFHENDVKTKLAKIEKEMKKLTGNIKGEFLKGWLFQSKEYHKKETI